MPQEHTDIPEGFTLKLALVDAIPVLEFCATMVVVALKFHSALFIVGAAASALAGCGKVAWKIVLACCERNVTWLNKQFKYLMSAGFVLMVVAVVASWGSIDVPAVLARAASLPSGAAFALGIVGMVAMGVMGAKLDKTNARHNWIEQLTNAAAQAAFLVGVLLY